MFEDMKNLILEDKIEGILSYCKEMLRCNPDMQQDFKELFYSINRGEFDKACLLLEQLCINYNNFEVLSLLMHYFKKNVKRIKEVYGFLEKFDDEKPKISIFLDNYFLIGQKKDDDLFKIESLDDLKKISNNPSLISYNGCLYQSVGLSTLGTFCDNILSEDLAQFMKFAKYYNALYTLFGIIDEKAQRYFSENKIGIYVSNNEIYFIKFIPLLNLAPQQKQQKLVLLDASNSGTIIGVKLEGNNKLTDFVQFELKDNENDSSLNMVFTLDASIYFPSSRAEIDFSSEEGLKLFIEILNERIDAGIEIIHGKKQFKIDSPEEIKRYIMIELQRIDKIESLNARISKLSNLIQISKDQATIIDIKKTLEENYLIYLNYLFEHNNDKEIVRIIKKFKNMGLYSDVESKRTLLLAISNSLKSSEIPPNEMLNLINLIESEYNFIDDDYLILSDTYFRVMAKLALDLILSGRINEIKNMFNNKFIGGRTDVLSILVPILCNLHFDSTEKRKSLEKFIETIKTILDVIQNSDPTRKYIENYFEEIENFFIKLIDDSSFIEQLLKEKINLLELINERKLYLFSDSSKGIISFIKHFNVQIIKFQLSSRNSEDKVTCNKTLFNFYKRNYAKMIQNYFETFISLIYNTQNEVDVTFIINTLLDLENYYLKKTRNLDPSIGDLIQKWLRKWYLTTPYIWSDFDSHYQIVSLLGERYFDKNELDRMKRNIKLNEHLSVIKAYNDPAQIQKSLEEYVMNYVKKSELFETEYFEYLESLLRADFSSLFNFSVSLFHLRTLQMFYNGVERKKLSQSLGLFEQNVSTFLNNKIIKGTDSAIQTVREYLQLVEVYVPNIIQNGDLLSKFLENLSQNLNMQSLSIKLLSLYNDLFNLCYKFNKFDPFKDKFIEIGCDIFSLLFQFPFSSLENPIIEAIEGFLTILLSKIEKKHIQLISKMNSAIESTSKILSPTNLSQVKKQLKIVLDTIENIKFETDSDPFIETKKVLKAEMQEIDDTESFFDKIKNNDKPAIERIIIILEEKVEQNKANQFDYHLLVVACIKIDDKESARNIAIKGMRERQSQELLQKIINNFIKITDKREYSRIKTKIPADLQPIFRLHFK